MFEKPYIQLIHPKTKDVFNVPHTKTLSWTDYIKIVYQKSINNIILSITHDIKKDMWYAEVTTHEGFYHEDLSPQKTPQEAFDNLIHYLDRAKKLREPLEKEFI